MGGRHPEGYITHPRDTSMEETRRRQEKRGRLLKETVWNGTRNTGLFTCLHIFVSGQPSCLFKTVCVNLVTRITSVRNNTDVIRRPTTFFIVNLIATICFGRTKQPSPGRMYHKM